MIKVHIEMEEDVKDVEKLLNAFLDQNKANIDEILDVSVNQNVNGKGWCGAITYKEKAKPKRGVTLGRTVP